MSENSVYTMSGTYLLKRAEFHLRTMNVQDDLQHQKMKKTSKKFGKWFVPIVVWPFVKWQRKLGFQKPRVMRFSILQLAQRDRYYLHSQGALCVTPLSERSTPPCQLPPTVCSPLYYTGTSKYILLSCQIEWTTEFLNKKWFDMNDVLCRPTQMYKNSHVRN